MPPHQVPLRIHIEFFTASLSADSALFHPSASPTYLSESGSRRLTLTRYSFMPRTEKTSLTNPKHPWISSCKLILPNEKVGVILSETANSGHTIQVLLIVPSGKRFQIQLI